MTLYIANSFSLNMLDLPTREGKWFHIYVEPINPLKAKKIIEKADKVVSCIGHESTAKLLSQLLGIEIKPERRFIKLAHGDEMIIIQLTFRPEEGKVYNFQELLKLLEEKRITLLHLELSDFYIP